MSPAKEPARKTRSSNAEDWLRKAMAARTPQTRERYARKGLSTRKPLDPTTHALLLRQLYLSLWEVECFDEALEIAVQATELGVLPDVLHQDAARAALAKGDLETTLFHLRSAARRGPPSRRSFHHWTLGSILFLAQRYDESIGALVRATRWATRERPLYRAHLALARLAAGEKIDELQETIDALIQSPCGQGYGRFILGHLAYAAGEWRAARRYLETFVKRTERDRPQLLVSLHGELKMARATLGKMSHN